MRHRTLVAVILSCTAGAALLAQQVQSRPDPQQPPGRDAAGQRRGVGTATISGQVVALDTGRPLSRVRVTLSSAELGESRVVTTDQTGRYAAQNLPAGRYNISASKPGFVSVAWGQRRPGRGGRPFPLADGERARGVDFLLPRGSVVTGHVFDEDGEPLVGAQVRVMRFSYVQGERRLTPAGSATSDDRGEYRVYGLLPGTYYVAATSTQSGTVVWSQSGELLSFTAEVGGVTVSSTGAGPVNVSSGQPPGAGFAPTYYPGVTSVADALPIPVGLQAEAGNIDFILQLVPTARVSGIATAPDGGPATGGSVTLSPDDGGVTGRFLGQNYSSGIRPDGTFMIMNVPPGRYVAFARGQGRRAGEQLFGSLPVAVSGADVTGVNLGLTPGLTVSGMLSADAGSSNLGNVTRVRVSLASLSSLPIPTPPPSGVLLDGSFSITPVVAGTYLVRVSGLPQSFALKGAYYGGRDVSDVPLEVRTGQNPAGIEIVVSDRVTEMTGTVQDADGQLLTDYTVVAFSSDASNWRPQSRYIQVGRPDANGQFRIRGLPPGDYLIAALDDVESGEWYDPAFLDGVRRGATRVSLGEGDVKTIELKLTGGH